MGNITTMQHCTPQGIVNAVEFACDGNVSLSESRGQTDDKPKAILPRCEPMEQRAQSQAPA